MCVSEWVNACLFIPCLKPWWITFSQLWVSNSHFVAERSEAESLSQVRQSSLMSWDFHPKCSVHWFMCTSTPALLWMLDHSFLDSWLLKFIFGYLRLSVAEWSHCPDTDPPAPLRRLNAYLSKTFHKMTPVPDILYEQMIDICYSDTPGRRCLCRQITERLREREEGSYMEVFQEKWNLAPLLYKMSSCCARKFSWCYSE